jgi:hypothetical protein
MFFTKRRGYRTIAGVSILFAEKTIQWPLDGCLLPVTAVMFLESKPAFG